MSKGLLEKEKKFEKLSMDWIDRLFFLFQEIYKDRWSSLLGNESKQLTIKTIWSTALSGLTSDEIKSALNICRSNPDNDIPTPVEFYHYAKKIRNPKSRKTHFAPAANSVVARRYLDKIKAELK